MKSKMKRRMLAIVLCMVIVLSNSSFIFASSESGTPAVEAASTEGTTSQTETDTQGTETTPQTLAVSESTPAPTDEPAAPTSVEATPTPTDTPEVTTTPEPTGTPTPEATPTPTDTPETTTTPEPTDTPEITTTPQPTDAPETTTTPEPTDTPEATPTPTQGPENGTSDTVQPTETPTPTEAPVKSNEAVELKQEFKDSDGNVTSTVKAQIPEGTFAADASEITMEVQTPDTASAEHVKEMMEELLPENHMLGDYIFYDIQFKVNGTVTEPQKPITITFEGEELSVKDVKRANVFWLDPEDPKVDGDKDQLVEITQKSEMIENLQNSGQSTENIDDYDLSEITLKEDGTSDKIQMEGRTSTIYGCYVVYEPVQVLTYDDDQVTVTVSAAEEGIIPANAELKVVPITAEDKNTEDQYKEVEQKLQEKAVEDAYDIAGFLAYDITFVDEDGNETEPGGEVKVSIDYKEAAIPETISEEDAANAEVTVFHLEEDEKGEVKEVVDMAQEEKVDVLATTEENKVEKVEVRTESFATYVISWNHDYWTYGLTIHIVDKNGNPIGNEIHKLSDSQRQELRSQAGLNLEKYGADDDEWCPEGYYLIVARLDNVDGTDAGKVYYYDQRWRYSDETTDERYRYNWTGDSGQRHVYLIYGKEEDEELSTVDTVENLSQYGISISMQNLDFNNEDNGLDQALGGQYTGPVKQNLVQSRLNDDYPTTVGGISLASLFNAGTSVNNFFIWDTLDQDGYFEYSSFDNYAYLNGNTFKIYNQMGAVSKYENAGETEFYFHRGNFLPYNDLTGMKSLYLTNLYDEDGNRIARDNERFGQQLYNSNGFDYHFSMQMEATFLQPEKGITENGEEMVFEFNGDDDMWVYINDVLVLDIGGEHDAHSGTINFATGVVNVNISATQTVTTSLNKLYEKAEVFPDGTEWEDSKINDYFVSTGKQDAEGDLIYRFKDYNRYTMKMFYMERGGGASNLHIKFNLETVPAGTIEVEKQVTNTNSEDYANEEFEFQVKVKERADDWSDTNPKYTDNYVVLTPELMMEEGITATLGQDETLQMDADGTFRLKSGESAIFNGLEDTRQYKVTEIGVKEVEFDEVWINNSEVDIFDDDDELSETEVSASTGDLLVQNDAKVVFRNHCSSANSRELKITKQMENGQPTNDTFDFKIYLENQSGNLVPYQGVFYIMDANSNYYVYDNNQQLVQAADENSRRNNTINGAVHNIPVGYTIAITGIMSGTEFKVEEINYDTSIYNEPVISPENCGTPTITGANGAIELKKDAIVTVINSLKDIPDNPYIQIEKKFEGIENPDTVLPNFAIEVYSKESCDEESLITTLNLEDNGESNTFVWKLDNLEAGTYYLKESDYTIGNYKVTTIINDKEVTEWPVKVDTQAPELESVGEFIRKDSCSNEDFDFLNNYNFVVASLKASNNYFVWSAEPLSAGERQAIRSFVALDEPLSAGERQAIRSFVALDNSFNQITASNATINFYSGLDNLQNGITINGGTIKVTEPNDLGVRTLSFVSSKSQWQHVLFGQYQIKPGANAEIEITNSYTPKTVEIDLQKYGTKYEMDPLTGAKFELYKATEDKETDGSITITKDSRIAEYDITDAPELSLESGYYILKETQAPVGYQLLNDEILFKVENQQVKLLKGSYDTNSGRYTQVVEEQDNVLDMWKVERVDNTITIKIKNKALYDLPSAGSSGIFGYTMGGTLLLMAGTLILYKMKRKEVQES